MNITNFNRRVFSCCLGLSVNLSSFLMAQSSPYSQPVSQANIEDCSKELLLAYFPQVFVTETLKKFKISQNQWESIIEDLSHKDKDVIKIIEEKASKINPNPLKDPQQRQTAVKIFRETLLEIFSNVMKAHGITDEKQIQAMLEDIQQQKAKRFAQCMQRHRDEQMRNQNPQSREDDRDDNDDNDDDDDDDDSDDDNKYDDDRRSSQTDDYRMDD